MTKKFAKQSSLILDYGKNGKTLKKFPDGGELKKKKPSERKPIITNDPKDPRLKAYNDSLSAYNLTQTRLKQALNKGEISDGRGKNIPVYSVAERQYLDRKRAIETDFEKYKKMGLNLTKKDIEDEYKQIDYKKGQVRDDAVGYYRFKHVNDAGTYTLADYKKPVQPVVYQKSIPNGTNTPNSKGQILVKDQQPVVYKKPNPQPNPKSELKNQSETEEQIERIEGYDITPTENKKVTPKPTQEKTDFYIQSLDKDGKQKVKYFNSKKEKDDYDEKLSKDFYPGTKTDNSTQYTAILPEMEKGGELPLPPIGSKAYYDALKAKENKKSDNTTISKKPRKLSEEELKEYDKFREKQEKNRFAKNSNYTREELTTREKRTPESDEHRRKQNQKYANSHGGYVNKNGDYVQGLGNDAADTKIANRTYDNIVEPLINAEMVISGVGALGKGALKVATEAEAKQLLKQTGKKVLKDSEKEVVRLSNYGYKSSTSQRTPWLDIKNPNYNLNSKNKFLENADNFGKMESGVVKGNPSTEESIMNSFISNKPKENFKSEIDWGKWNKEIPDNSQLIKEYNTIEQSSKANGSWMKNPDGSAFQGSPEQFVQQNSENFKKAFPDGAVQTYRGSGVHNPELINNKDFKSVFTGDENLARAYGNAYSNKNYQNYFNPNIPTGEELLLKNHPFKDLQAAKLDPKNRSLIRAYSQSEDAGVYNLYSKNTGKNLKIDAKGADWKKLPQQDNLPYLASNDDVAKYIDDNNLDQAFIKNVHDGISGDVLIAAHKKGNYLKSAIGNNGMFDMSNPNIYKALIPAAVAGAASQQEYKNGGTMNKLGVENSLWNNIRVKSGSGKKPTKEMLKQEKKIKRKAPDGITLDGEYPFVGNLKKMYENAVQGQQQQVQQIGAKVGQQVADTLMPITPVNNVQKNKPNQNQYNDFNAYQQDLTDWEKENNQRSDYKGDTVEKDGIAVVQMTDKELKNPSKQQWGNHLAKPTPPKNERKRGNYAPYFLGGLAAADLLLPDVNRERQQDFNRPEDEPYYNPYPNGLGSGALAKHGKTLESDDLQLLSKDSYIKPLSPSILKLKGKKHGEENSDFGEGIPLAANGQVIEAEDGENFAEQTNGNKVILSGKTIDFETGESFEELSKEIAKFENKKVVAPQNRLNKLLTTKDIDPQDKFDQLTMNTVRAKQMGIEQAQEFVQMKTDEIAQRQEAILQISESTGMKPNEVSKQMKTAKYGMTIPKAPDGETLTKNGTTYKKRSRFSEGVNEIDLERVDGKTRRFGKKDIEKQVKQGKDDGSKKVGFEKDKYSVKMLQEGVSPEQLAKKGLIHKDEIPKAKQYYKPKSEYEYIEQDRGELIPIESNVKPGGIVPKGNVQPVGNITPVPNTQPQPLTFDTEEQITPIEYGKVKNGNWKNYVGPAFGVLDRVNNRSDPGINPRLKDVGEFQNRKLAQINSQGRAFQQGATSTGASVAELATGMGGFAEQAANSEAEIQAFNQGNKNMVYNENIGIVNDFAKFNSEINTRNNERRLMAEGNTKTRNIEALNTIGKYSAMEDRDRNDFVVNQGYYPTYGHDKNTLQPNVRPNQNPFDNDAMFQVGDGRYSRNTPSSTQVRTKDGNTTTTNTYTPQKSITPPKPKKVKYGMSLVKEFKRYKP